MIAVLFLLIGLALLIKGGGVFVSAAVRLAAFLRMPRMVIGSTLVSLATTTPELAVSLMAGAQGQSDLAVGNAVGSVICNLALILGVTAVLRPMDVHPRTMRRPAAAMFTAGVLLTALTADLVLQRWQGLLLVAIGLGYFAWDFAVHARGSGSGDAGAGLPVGSGAPPARTWWHTRAGTVMQFVLGAVVVVAGSRLLVDGAVQIAGRLGIPTIVIGLTVVAVGTSLPEFVTALTSSREAVSDLAIGNVLGANVANLTIVVGAAAALREVRMDVETQRFNFPAMLLIMGLAWWMLRSDRRMTRTEGAVLLAIYGVYLSVLVGLAVAHG